NSPRRCSKWGRPAKPFFFSSRRRHTSFSRDWSSDVCSSDLTAVKEVAGAITSATLATVAVFAPIGFVGGFVGELFRPFALTVARSEERRVGKEGRRRWAPHRVEDDEGKQSRPDLP